jgi:hypothetical protein
MKLSDEIMQRAAMHLALGRSIPKTAAALGISEKSIDRWKQDPAFKVRINAELALIRERIVQEGMSVKANRIMAKRRRHAAFMRVIQKRAGNPSRGGADWDDTGWVVQRQRNIGGGEFGRDITEFETDTATSAHLTDLEDSIAREMGEMESGAKAAAPVEIRITHVPSLPHD